MNNDFCDIREEKKSGFRTFVGRRADLWGSLFICARLVFGGTPLFFAIWLSVFLLSDAAFGVACFGKR